MYICKNLINNTCVEWVEYQPDSFSDQLASFASLSLDDVTKIWLQVLLLFAVAYVFKHLPFFVRRL